MKRLSQFAILATIALATTNISAQEPTTGRRVVLSDPVEHPSKPTALTVQQMRQQIAMEKSRQRRARLERNAGNQHHPLRPVASDMPFMRSNYISAYYHRYHYLPIVVR